MNLTAFLKNENITVLVTDKVKILFQKEFSLGVELLNLIYADDDKVSKHLIGLANADLTVSPLFLFEKKKSIDCLYLDLITWAGLEDHKHILSMSLPEVEEFIETLGSDFNTFSNYPNYKAAYKDNPRAAVLMFMIYQDYMNAKNYFWNELFYCVEKLADLPVNERILTYELLARDNQVFNVIIPSCEFKYRLFPTDYPLEREITPDFIEMHNRQSKRKNSGLDVENIFSFERVIDLIQFEFSKMFELKAPLKVCRYCNRYFIPEKRIDTEYCNRPIAGYENKTCASIGAVAKYQEKVKENPVYMEFERAYKRRSAQKRAKKITGEEFSQWSKEMRAMRDQCLNGIVSFEMFKECLNMDKKKRKL